jgi:hypothetical protein
MSTKRTDRWYRGVLIQGASVNSSGIRWFARLGDGRVVRAETLQDIKQLITIELENHG